MRIQGTPRWIRMVDRALDFLFYVATGVVLLVLLGALAGILFRFIRIGWDLVN